MNLPQRDEVFRRYALILALIPDTDAADDIFRVSRDEADLRRRAVAWSKKHGVPNLQSAPPLPALDEIQQEHALHLARLGAKRRLLLPAATLSAVALLGVLVILATWWERKSVGVFEHGYLRIPVTALHRPVTTNKLSDFGGQSPYTDRVYIVSPPDGPILAFSGRDLAGNHCSIPWVPAEAAFHEVCRGTVFNLDGKIIAGPGPFGMGQFSVSIEHGTIVVDVTHPPDPVEERCYISGQPVYGRACSDPKE